MFFRLLVTILLVLITSTANAIIITPNPSFKTLGSISQGSYKYYEFAKLAGSKYNVCIKTTSGDADLYGHWTSSVSNTVWQFHSENGGATYDYISFEASQTGTYYIAVYGYNASTFSIYVTKNSMAVTTSQLHGELVCPIASCGNGNLTSTQYGPFGSVWGNSEQDPFFDGYNDFFHVGVDQNTDYNDNVSAVADGVVKRVGSSGTEWGYYVVIEHSVNNYTFTTTYEHLQFSGRPLVDDQVYAGEQIGKIYNITEQGEVNHLHLSMHSGQYRETDNSVLSRSNVGALLYNKFPQDFFNAGNINLYE